MSLHGKTALITGSTSGIGLGIAEQLAREGSTIIINGFGTPEDIKNICDRLQKDYNVKCVHKNADISDPISVQKMIDDSVAEFKSLDILINNAGIQHVALTEDFPIDQWKKIIDINLSGVFYGIKSALPHMKKQKHGRIINIASAHGLVASKQKAAYVAAKHGVVGLTKVVALENALNNITCNAICPGWVLTPLVQKQIDALMTKDALSLETATEKLLGEKQPNLRFATPEEIGDMVIYLCQESARGVTGTTLSIDGGWTAQ
jgi:3-hydroxybutyrate dehydrogenase